MPFEKSSGPLNLALDLPASRKTERKLMNSVTMQGILERHFPAYRLTHDVPKYQLRAADAMTKCRTAAMGYHASKCEQGHVIDIHYNSCKHRACPQCARIQIERWLDKQRSRLIKCAHFHVIFTIPKQVNLLWVYNSTLLADFFFCAVRDTLFKMLENPRHLGAKPGLHACLQTWGRDLSLHPHIHCLVTAGGLNELGEWVSLRHPGFLLPGKAVAAVFRGKMLYAIRCAIEAGLLRLPKGMHEQGALNLLNKLGRAEWNVHICERYAYGEGVVIYLANYVKGGPLSNGRLISSDSTGVTFEYKDHHDNKTKKMRLKHGEFIRRILSHVPEVRLRTFRSYGLYYRRNKDLLNRSRRHFSQPPVKDPDFLGFEEFLKRKGIERPLICSICGGGVAIIEKHYKRGAPCVLVPVRKAA